MSNYTTLFEKFIGLIDWKLLQKYTLKLNTDYKVQSFFTQNHLISMIYFHLTERTSLRDLHQAMQDILGNILSPVSLSMLSNHNNSRDYRVFLPVMNNLIQRSLQSLTRDERLAKFGTTKIIDSTTISMCLRFFDWAEFRSTKAGVKMHTCTDAATGVPERVIFSNAKCHDRSEMDNLMTEKDTIYICDRGYVDYKKFDEYTSNNIYFVSRLKQNAQITTLEQRPITYADKRLLPQGCVILCDRKVRLGSEYNTLTKKTYRLIKMIDPSGKDLTFITNVMDFATEEIAWLYKRRWDIELFFKWIKQHCKIKTFIGHSENAVRLQLVTGIITYLLYRLTWEQVPKIKSLIILKRKVENMLLKPVFAQHTYEDIFFNSA